MSAQNDSASHQDKKFPVSAFAAGVAGAILAFILFWFLGFGATPAPVVVPATVAPLGGQDLLQVQEATNQGLKAEIERLKVLLSGDVCANAPTPPSHMPITPLPSTGGQSTPHSAPSPSAPSQPQGRDAKTTEPSSSPSAAPQYNGTIVPTAPPFEEPKTVADLLAQSTVFIFTRTNDGFGFGTGFFVAPGIVATNRHVVESSPDGRIFVSNPTLR